MMVMMMMVVMIMLVLASYLMLNALSTAKVQEFIVSPVKDLLLGEHVTSCSKRIGENEVE